MKIHNMNFKESILYSQFELYGVNVYSTNRITVPAQRFEENTIAPYCLIVLVVTTILRAYVDRLD